MKSTEITKTILISFRMILVLLQITALLCAIYVEVQGYNYRILYLGADKTTELKATWFFINIAYLHLSIKKLSVNDYKLINSTIHITITTLITIFNSLVGSKLAQTWKFLTHSRITNIQLSEHFTLQKNWSVQDKIDYAYEIIKKYNDVDPSTVDIILSKVRNNININIEQIPDLINTLINQYKKINAVQNHGWSHTIKNALYQAFMGDYWYIGWAGVTITTVLSVIYVKDSIGILIHKDQFLEKVITKTNKRIDDIEVSIKLINKDSNKKIDDITNTLNDVSKKIKNNDNMSKTVTSNDQLVNNQINDLKIKVNKLSQKIEDGSNLLNNKINEAQNRITTVSSISTTNNEILTQKIDNASINVMTQINKLIDRIKGLENDMI